MRSKNILNPAMSLGLIIVLFVIQVFPPFWTNDVTSLRHFFLAIVDIVGIGFILFSLFKGKKTLCPMKFPTMRVFVILLLWMGLSVFWAMNSVESVAVLNRWFLIFMLAFCLSSILANNNKIFHVMVYCAMAIALVNVLTCIISYYYLDCANYPKRIPSINGGYGNKNIFAVCLMCKLPFLYYALFRYKKVFKVISAVLIIAICFCLPIISTRSAFVCLALNILILAIYAVAYFVKFKKKIYFLHTFLITAFLLGGFALGSWFVTYNYKHSSHQQKNEFDVSQRIKETGTGKSSKIRLIIWKNTSKIIKEKPIAGWGVGNHKLAIMKVETPQKGNFIVSDHAHNDFLEMFSELGVVGLLLYISIYLTMFIVAIKIMISSKTKEPFRVIALISLMLLITYMNDALFNFPNERATPQMYLAISIALMFFAWAKSRGAEKQKNLPVWLAIVLCLITIPATAIETMHCASSKLQLDRIVCFNNHNKNQIPPQYWEKHFPCIPNVDESTRPIAISVANMYAREGNYRKAIDIVLKDNSNPYMAMREHVLASWYSKIDKKDSALYYADQCLKIKPKFYDALAVKINVYKKQGNTEKVKELLYDFLSRDSLNYRPWCDLMNVYIGERDFENANIIWEKAHKTVPRSKKIFNKKNDIDSSYCEYSKIKK
ncbi:MAG: O-antigen ligase family protein [Bacteroidales bacterium]|nr:O-antigen ligase family protein [Bacteroidales bacterium]